MLQVLFVAHMVRSVANFLQNRIQLCELTHEAYDRKEPRTEEVELIDQFREWRPREHAEPIWSTESEPYDSGWCAVESSAR